MKTEAEKLEVIRDAAEDLLEALEIANICWADDGISPKNLMEYQKCLRAVAKARGWINVITEETS